MKNEYDWMIVFDDHEVQPQKFRGTVETAYAQLKSAAINWNCHLFRCEWSA